MASPLSERAIEDAIKHGRALLKFISPNNVGKTGSHEYGYYLPKPAWKLFTPYPPDKGDNKEHLVDITWPDGRVTNSRIIWYGKGTRSEYRLTRFGEDFPWRTEDNIGDLLVLIPTGRTTFVAHVLDLEEDIADLQAALGVEITDTWGIYDRFAEVEEDIDECMNRLFRQFASTLTGFPDTREFSHQAVTVIQTCVNGFGGFTPDRKIVDLVDAEYKLFRLVERRLCEDQIIRTFRSVDDFLDTAATIMNRRKSRAGRSLENHVEFVFREAAIPFEVRPDVDGKPDIVIPNKAAYDDPAFPDNKLFVIGVKTTCKDRWRQVLNEGARVQNKHLLTLQQGISSRQLNEMKASNLQLIVPVPLHDKYPDDSDMPLLGVEQFISKVRDRLAHG